MVKRDELWCTPTTRPAYERAKGNWSASGLVNQAKRVQEMIDGYRSRHREPLVLPPGFIRGHDAVELIDNHGHKHVFSAAEFDGYLTSLGLAKE